MSMPTPVVSSHGGFVELAAANDIANEGNHTANQIDAARATARDGGELAPSVAEATYVVGRGDVERHAGTCYPGTAMAKTDYETPATPEAQKLIADLFALGSVGYVALGRGQEVLLRAQPGLETTTSAETNFYEELLVNPTLLTLASQRGGLDCGGLAYIALGYGGFIQMIMRMRDGHVSLGVSSRANVGELAKRMQAVLERHGVAYAPPASSLLGT